MPLAVSNYLGQDPQNLIFKANVEKVNSKQIKITYTTCQYENVDVIYTFARKDQKLNIKYLIPDIEANIDFLVDGSVDINECDRNYDINIKTNANITVINEINCNRLTLAGNCILIEHNIKSLNRCTLEYQKKLENRGKLLVVASSLEFIGARGSKLSNFGVIDTRGVITFNIKNNHLWSELINYGLIFSRQDIFMNILSSSNFGEISSKAKITLITRSMFNQGIIFAEQDAGFRYSHQFINENSATIASNHDLYFSGLSSVSSKELKEKQIKQQRTFLNKGTTKAIRNLSISALEISNTLTGSVLGDKVNIYGAKFVNDGHIKGTNKVEISILSDLELKNLQNTRSVAMLTHTNMKLWFIRQLINNSVIQANEKLFIDNEFIEISKDEGKLVSSKPPLNSQNILIEGAVIVEQLSKITNYSGLFFNAVKCIPVEFSIELQSVGEIKSAASSKLLLMFKLKQQEAESFDAKNAKKAIEDVDAKVSLNTIPKIRISYE